jgi:transposase
MGYEHYIGVDLHKAFFQVCAVTPDGTREWEGRWPRSDEGIAALQARCTPGTAVAVEASTPTFHFADALTGHAGQVVIIDPLKTRLKAGYAAKTDRLDARRLADALRRESVVGIYHPPPAIRDLRELCRSRHALVQTRTALTLRLGAVLLRQGIGDAPPRLYRPRGLAWIDQLTLPAEAGASVRRLRRVLARVTEELDAVEADVARTAAADPIVAALDPIVGIGPTLGLLIRAEIGTMARFPTPGHLASYAGLVPRVDASAGRVRYGRITRRGSPWLRWALVEAAIHGPKRRDAEGRWARRLAIRKGALKARVAVARRLCDEIVARWPR